LIKQLVYHGLGAGGLPAPTYLAISASW